MKRALFCFFFGLGLAVFLGAAVLATLVMTGVLSQKKVSNFIKYSPLFTATSPVTSEQSIQTTLIRLKSISFSLPSMGLGFESGGGAILEVEGGILVAERSGKFFYFNKSSAAPILSSTKIAVDINQAGFERHALAQGYEVKPGRNVGYAGLGMRLHDLLKSRDEKHIMASYTHWDDADHCATLRVVIADLIQDGNVPSAGAWRQVFETKPCLQLSDRKDKPFAGHQAGGRMVELAYGKILLTVGDFKNDGEKRDLTVADTNNDYGKIYEIDLVSGKSQLFTWGHRNPQGLTIADDGAIWSTEHGPAGGDELNLITKGTNYGWPMVTLGRDCNGCNWQLEGFHDGYQPPVFSYVPSIGIGNLVQLHDFSPAWDGDFLVASMVEETLHHLRMNGHTVIYDEPIPMGARLRDMIQLKDGRIALWTDSGRLIFLHQDREQTDSEMLSADLSPVARESIKQCRTCHELDAGLGRQGRISLWEISGRERAAMPNVSYSPSLKAAGGYWTAENLDLFLANPQAAIPGTTMQFEGVSNPTLRKELVDFLGKLR
jgi:aldose sugar dehydrogenase